MAKRVVRFISSSLLQIEKVFAFRETAFAPRNLALRRRERDVPRRKNGCSGGLLALSEVERSAVCAVPELLAEKAGIALKLATRPRLEREWSSSRYPQAIFPQLGNENL
jgi:hypothetical protein